MTAQPPPTSAKLIADLIELVCDEYTPAASRAKAITIAYKIGLSEGRVEGAESMGERLTATVNKATERLPR